MSDKLNTTENKDFPPNQYQCWNCGGIFNKGRSDKEAAEELRNRMLDEKLEECATVCDDCYNKMIIIGRDISLEDAETIEALAAEVVRLRAAIVGAQIALARDENISAAMRILVATGVQNG